ncbi:MAG: hypothetical protein RLZ28_1084 [Actinomycetota bacterium]|jgi:mRNA interferase HigB
MRVISVSILKDFWAKHPSSEEPLRLWFAEARAARWAGPADLKAQYGSASILKNNRVVFNIAGNKFRLVAAIHYLSFALLIKFVGTHEEYDRIDAQTFDRKVNG